MECQGLDPLPLLSGGLRPSASGPGPRWVVSLLSPPTPCSRLHSNHLFCDCHLAWLSQWLRQRPTVGLFTQCSGPAGLRGLNVAEVQKSEFSCSGGCPPCRGSRIPIACPCCPHPPAHGLLSPHIHIWATKTPVLIRGCLLDHTPSPTLTHSLLSRLIASCPQSPPSPDSAIASCSHPLPLSLHVTSCLHCISPPVPYPQFFPVAYPLSLCPIPSTQCLPFASTQCCQPISPSPLPSSPSTPTPHFLHSLPPPIPTSPFPHCATLKSH